MNRDYKPYRAVAIAPKNAKFLCGDDGWEIHTDERLNSALIDRLIDGLALDFLESYLDFDAYENRSIKLTFEKDEAGLVIFGAFQIRTQEAMNRLQKVCESDDVAPYVQVYYPDKYGSDTGD